MLKFANRPKLLAIGWIEIDDHNHLLNAAQNEYKQMEIK
jgi:hypothetical protein